MCTRPILSALAIVIGTSACATVETQADKAPAQLAMATWAGVMPCADCIGIRTQLLLYTDQSSGKQVRYEMTETYMGAPGGERSVQSRGRWAVLRGSAHDSDAVVYQLDFDEPQSTRNFLLASHHELRLLDREQKELDTPVAHSLHLVGAQH